VFAEDSFDSDVREYAGVYSKVSRSAVELTKSLIYRIDQQTFADALETGAQINAKARMTEDCKQGIAKFLEK
ncbi:MAG TPA: hypothetical protein PLD38_10430, partial [Pyrinomonadaceae bacterium]|nr:hypothetical protein [Pyrinomonadaceae bacterium]